MHILYFIDNILFLNIRRQNQEDRRRTHRHAQHAYAIERVDAVIQRAIYRRIRILDAARANRILHLCGPASEKCHTVFQNRCGTVQVSTGCMKIFAYHVKRYMLITQPSGRIICAIQNSFRPHVGEVCSGIYFINDCR